MGIKKASLAKLSRPKLGEVYARERLFALLQGSPNCPITFVSGPAGSGKTTLVANFLDRCNDASIWFQADAGDSDPATFFHYLGLAAKQAAPRRKQPMPVLSPDHLPSIQLFARRFFEALYQRIKRPGYLIFDDYQQVLCPTSLRTNHRVSSLKIIRE